MAGGIRAAPRTGRPAGSVDCSRALTIRAEQRVVLLQAEQQKMTRSLETRVHKHIVTDVNSIIGDAYRSIRVTFYERYQ